MTEEGRDALADAVRAAFVPVLAAARAAGAATPPTGSTTAPVGTVLSSPHDSVPSVSPAAGQAEPVPPEEPAAVQWIPWRGWMCRSAMAPTAAWEELAAALEAQAARVQAAGDSTAACVYAQAAAENRRAIAEWSA